MKKDYVAPQMSEIEVEMESLLTSFSSQGDIEGPVGAKPHEGFWGFGGDASDNTPTRNSVWE